MVDGDDAILTELRDEYGGDWCLGRTYLDPERTQPHWWRATRRRQLTRRESYRGLAMTIFGDTAAELREALEAEADLAAMVNAEWVPDRHPAAS
ncbi:MAG: hypothetical protein ACRDOO_01165 [Actinomadura sp.]